MFSLFWNQELKKLPDEYKMNISEIEVKCNKFDEEFAAFVKDTRVELNDSKLRILADCSSLSLEETVKFIPMFKELDVVMGLEFEHELLRNPTHGSLVNDDDSFVWEGLKFQVMDIIKDLDTLLTVVNSFEIQKPNAIHISEDLVKVFIKKPKLVDGIHAFGINIKITANKGKRFFVLPREKNLAKHQFDLLQLIPPPVNPSTKSYMALFKYYTDEDFTDDISLIVHDAPELIEGTLPPIYHMRLCCPISCDDCKVCDHCETVAKNLEKENKIWKK